MVKEGKGERERGGKKILFLFSLPPALIRPIPSHLLREIAKPSVHSKFVW